MCWPARGPSCLSVLLLLAQEKPISCEITGFAQQLHQSRLRLCPLLGMSLSPVTPPAMKLQLTFKGKSKAVASRLPVTDASGTVKAMVMTITSMCSTI